MVFTNPQIQYYKRKTSTIYNRPMVSEHFNVPWTLKTEKYILIPLTINNLIKDHDAVMASVKHLKGLTGETYDWPESLTIEENLSDLCWHQRKFTLRHSFPYSDMSLEKELCLGCCYIYPLIRSQYDAQAFYWMRQEWLETGLENKLGADFKTWLENDWPFSKIEFPDRGES